VDGKSDSDDEHDSQEENQKRMQRAATESFFTLQMIHSARGMEMKW